MEIVELTPARKLEIYKAVLAYIKSHTTTEGICYSGICNAIYLVTKHNEPEPCFGGMSVNYPELAAHRPAHIESWRDVYWFHIDSDGTQQRVRIMEEIIQKMEAL